MNLQENNAVQAPEEPAAATAPEEEGPATPAVEAAPMEGTVPPQDPDSGTAPEAEAAGPQPGPEDGASASEPEPPSSQPPSDPEPAPDAVQAPPPVVEEDHPRLRRHHVAPAMIALDRIDDDRTFQMRPDGDIQALATDIARLGQLFPIDIRLKPPDRFQVICGFRRVAALRFLQRDRVLARLHSDLSDEDALLMALVSAIHARPVVPEELQQVKERLASEGRLTTSIRSMIEKALSPDDGLAPETVGEEQEVEAEQLADDVTLRLGEINQDLSLLADVFDSLDAQKQEQLLQQLRYSSDLVAYLEARK